MPNTQCDKCGKVIYVAPKRFKSESYTGLCQECYLTEAPPRAGTGREAKEHKVGIMAARKASMLEQFPIDFDFSWKPLRDFYKDWVDTCWRLGRLHIAGRDRHNVDRMYAWFQKVRPNDATTLDLGRIVEKAQSYKDQGVNDWGEILELETCALGRIP